MDLPEPGVRRSAGIPGHQRPLCRVDPVPLGRAAEGLDPEADRLCHHPRRTPRRVARVLDHAPDLGRGAGDAPRERDHGSDGPHRSFGDPAPGARPEDGRTRARSGARIAVPSGCFLLVLDRLPRRCRPAGRPDGTGRPGPPGRQGLYRGLLAAGLGSRPEHTGRAEEDLPPSRAPRGQSDAGIPACLIELQVDNDRRELWLRRKTTSTIRSSRISSSEAIPIAWPSTSTAARSISTSRWWTSTWGPTPGRRKRRPTRAGWS